MSLGETTTTKRFLTVALLLWMFTLPFIFWNQSINQPQPDKTAKFALASWTYPDAHGQGIQYVSTYFDSVWNDTIEYFEPTGNMTVDVPEGTNVTIAVFSWVNGTYCGFSSLADGKNFIRHSVLVTTPSNSSVFAQQNFTYIVGSDSIAPMYFYRYDVILDFAFQASTIYTVVLTYEVFYPEV